MNMTLDIAFGLLTAPPLHRQRSPSEACMMGELLACAFATWIKDLHGTGGVAMLFDADKANITRATSLRANATRDRPLSIPEQWLTGVQATVRSRPLFGGVCLGSVVSANGKTASKRCYIGSTALLSYLLEAFGTSAFFIKVDTDTVFAPQRVATWLTPDLLYGGNNNHNPHFLHCEGQCTGWACKTGIGPNRTCIRSTDDFVALEASVRGVVGGDTPARHALRQWCTQLHASKVKMRDLMAAAINVASRSNTLDGAMEQAMTNYSNGSEAAHRLVAALPESVASFSPSAAAGNAWRQGVESALFECRPFQYGRGGAYILARATLRLIVQNDCVSRVAAVRCSGWGKDDQKDACEWSVQHEDVAVGLCSHLAGIRITTNTDPTSLATRHMGFAMHSSKCFGTLGTKMPARRDCALHEMMTTHPVKNGKSLLSLYESIFSPRAKPIS